MLVIYLFWSYPSKQSIIHLALTLRMTTKTCAHARPLLQDVGLVAYTLWQSEHLNRAMQGRILGSNNTFTQQDR